MAHLHISGECEEETKGDMVSDKHEQGYDENESTAASADKPEPHSEGGGSQERSNSKEVR